MRSFTSGIVVGILLTIIVGTTLQTFFSKLSDLDSRVLPAAKFTTLPPCSPPTTLPPPTTTTLPPPTTTTVRTLSPASPVAEPAATGPAAAKPAAAVPAVRPSLSLSQRTHGYVSVMLNGLWRPVCGDGFWSNDNGANSVCQELGFLGGRVVKKHIILESDAVYVGRCLPGELLLACTENCCNAGCPQNSVGCGACKAGFANAFRVECVLQSTPAPRQPVPVPAGTEGRIFAERALRHRRCSIELWSVTGKSRKHAERECLSDQKCAGLMQQAGTYQGCGGILLPKAHSSWEVLLRQGLTVSSTGSFSMAVPAEAQQEAPRDGDAPRAVLDAIIRGRRCSIELWMQVAMWRTDAEEKCSGDPKCQGLMYYAKDGGDGRFVRQGWFQGCGGTLDSVPNTDWDVLLLHGLQIGESGEFKSSADHNFACCAPFELGRSWAGWFDRHVSGDGGCCTTVVGVSTGKMHHSTRTVPVFQSWFQRLGKGMFAFFVSDDDEYKLPMMILRDQSYQKRTVEFLLLMAARPPVRYEWLLLTEDDTFVVPHLLSSFVAGKPSTEAHFFGSDANLGAGVLVSHSTMAVLDQNVRTARREFSSDSSEHYAKVLKNLLVGKFGIPFTNTHQFHSDRKVLEEGWHCWKSAIVTMHPIMGKQTRLMDECLSLGRDTTCEQLGPALPGSGVWRQVYESRRCVRTLWEARDTNRLSAIRRCELDDMCLGLMEYRGPHQGGECGGSYRGCGGGLDEEADCGGEGRDWDIKLLPKTNPKHFQACVECFISPQARQMEGSVYNYEWSEQGRFGNMLMTYWNGRALAVFRGQSFRAKIDDSNPSNAFLRRFRTDAAPEQIDRNSLTIYQKLAKRDGFSEHAYPHSSPVTPWRLILETMTKETGEVVNGLLRDFSLPIQGAEIAAVYIRCDVDIVGEAGEVGTPEYGLLPHRFIGQRLPATVSKIVLLLGKRNRQCKLCPMVISDLTSYLERLNRTVEVWEPSDGPLESDWARLATFQTAFSWPSTFSFTALVGSAHRVFFPYDGKKMLFVAPPRSIPEMMQGTSGNFNWVEIDFLPGRILNRLTWEEIRTYLHSESCDPSVVPCAALPQNC